MFCGAGGGRKTKNPEGEHIVATLAHLANRGKTGRKNVVITLGATRSAIDDVRHVQNTSSGSTGYALQTTFTNTATM